MTLWVLVLTWCARPTPDTQEQAVVEKQPYFIATSSVEDLSTANTVVKSGRLVWAQAVTVSSLVPWRVRSINYNNWDTLTANTTVVGLQDTWGNFSFNAQRAKAQLDSARINYTSTERNLNKAIEDTWLWIKQAEIQANASNQQGWWSSSLQLQQLEQQIAKAELDYQTQLQNNQQTLENFVSTTRNLARDIQLLYTEVIDESDKILWISITYKHLNDWFERTLWAKNTTTKRLAEEELRTLMRNKAAYDTLWAAITSTNLTESLTTIKNLAQDLQPLLDWLEEVFIFTESSPITLSASQLAWFVSIVDWLQNQVQGQVSSLTQQINSIQSFLNTYKQQEESLRKQVDITKQQVATTRSSLQDSEQNAQIWVESATNNYVNALESKNTTLASLSNSIEQARIAYNEAQTQLWKFSVETPIDGVIGEILVDVWQEVNPWTPLFTINSTNQQQVEISLSDDDIRFVEPGQKVTVVVDEVERSGTIQSISSTADQNFTYKTTINLEWTVDVFGDVVDVRIPVRTPYPVIPINVVTILKRNEWLIQIWDGNQANPYRVNFGKVWWSNVEITSELDDDLELIISDIKNFNPNKQIMQIKS